MKTYLLTWYGITDLRAALGIEYTDGPIFSALKTGFYTDVVILAYTDPGKKQRMFSGELRAGWEAWRQSPAGTRPPMSREKSQELVDAVSNTAAGHALFRDWLEEKLFDADVACDIHLIPCELKQLNDARGIYAAATSALFHALSDDADKTLTVFISPGTPVMAYTWALLARTNPQHGIGIIASSDWRRPPEKIEGLKELMLPALGAPKPKSPDAYDVIIHLLGKERMPIYFGMIQFPAKEHIFVTTKEYADAVPVLARVLPEGSRHKTVTVQSAFAPDDTYRTIVRQFQKHPAVSGIGVNLTGGTKLMFAGALTACWECGLEPFYFEINHHSIIFLRNGSAIPFNAAKRVEDFFSVNGFRVVAEGRWEDNPASALRADITKKMWDSRKIMGALYQTPDSRVYNSKLNNAIDPPFNWQWKNSNASFTAKGEASLVLEGEPLIVGACRDFGRYLLGGWLEEHTYSLLKTLEQEGLIFDLRIGVEVDYVGDHLNQNGIPIGEFDCAFTDGKRLWLVECKAGNVKQEHIQKLENNLKMYGGIAAKGILVSAFPISPKHMKRIDSSTSIKAVQSFELSTEFLRKIIV